MSLYNISLLFRTSKYQWYRCTRFGMNNIINTSESLDRKNGEKRIEINRITKQNIKESKRKRIENIVDRNKEV